MADSYDVIIVGSGPAGVSAAFPLIKAGLNVLMLDGGSRQDQIIPNKPFLTERYESDEQWKWIIGNDYYALKNNDAVSPKLRVPAYRYVFESFLNENQIEPSNFVAVGSLAKGGLSNAWGCGVARLASDELADYPFPESDIVRSYEAVSRRIGISGANDDDMAGYFGLDSWSQPPIAMDELHQQMFERYSVVRECVNATGFQLGRSRVAVLSREIGKRKACEKLDNCLWGCHLKALYSSADEVSTLSRNDNFYYRSGVVVDKISSNSDSVTVEGNEGAEKVAFVGNKVVLAAGTLATTRLVLGALNINKNIRLQSCPTAAFLLWLPRMLGTERSRGFGLGQLSYLLKLNEETAAFGSTFSTSGIPVSEFVRHLPLCNRYGVDILRQLLSSCLVGNLFLPGNLSTTSASLDPGGALKIDGGQARNVDKLMSMAAGRLRKSYWKLGAILLPMSFTQARPGGDIHYSSTLPMRNIPSTGETDANGELAGLAGVHVVDGACLPTLTEKSHTLTIMANADRIGLYLANKMKEI